MNPGSAWTPLVPILAVLSLIARPWQWREIVCRIRNRDSDMAAMFLIWIALTAPVSFLLSDDNAKAQAMILIVARATLVLAYGIIGPLIMGVGGRYRIHAQAMISIFIAFDFLLLLLAAFPIMIPIWMAARSFFLTAVSSIILLSPRDDESKEDIARRSGIIRTGLMFLFLLTFCVFSEHTVGLIFARI